MDKKKDAAVVKYSVGTEVRAVRAISLGGGDIPADPAISDRTHPSYMVADKGDYGTIETISDGLPTVAFHRRRAASIVGWFEVELAPVQMHRFDVSVDIPARGPVRAYLRLLEALENFDFGWETQSAWRPEDSEVMYPEELQHIIMRAATAPAVTQEEARATVQATLDAPKEIFDARPPETHKEFAQLFARVVNQNSLENQANVPDFVLGTYLASALEAFNQGIRDYARWWGTDERKEAIDRIVELAKSMKPVREAWEELCTVLEAGGFIDREEIGIVPRTKASPTSPHPVRRLAKLPFHDQSIYVDLKMVVAIEPYDILVPFTEPANTFTEPVKTTSVCGTALTLEAGARLLTTAPVAVVDELIQATEGA